MKGILFISVFVICTLFLPECSKAWTINLSWEEFNVGDRGSSSYFSPDIGGSVSDTYSHSGTKSYEVALSAGKENTGQHAFAFPSNIYEGGKVWARAYLYAPSGFDWSCNPIAKILRLAVLESGGQTQMGYISILEIQPSAYGCSATSNDFGYIVGGSEYYGNQLSWPQSSNYVCQNRNIDQANYLTLGQWHCIELYAKAGSNNNGIMRAWHNGELIWEHTNINNIPPNGYIGNGIIMGHLLGWWNGGVPQNQNIYFDDVLITNETPTNRDAEGNSYIGPISENVTDTTPPVISNGSPTGTLPSGTTQTTMLVATNENAICRYSTNVGTSYSSMTNTFSATGGTFHSINISGLQNNQTHSYYIRCQDQAGNPNTNDYVITFSIASESTTISVDSTYPGYSANVIDDGIINAYGKTSTTWASDESATSPHWITINFPNTTQVDFVNVWWAYNDYRTKLMTSQQLDIQYWNGSSYATAATLLYPDSDVANSSATFPAVTTTSLHFYQPANMGNPVYPTVLWITELDYGFCHKSDQNCNSCVEMSELNAFIDRWKVNNLDVTMPEMMGAIGLWKRGC